MPRHATAGPPRALAVLIVPNAFQLLSRPVQRGRKRLTNARGVAGPSRRPRWSQTVSANRDSKQAASLRDNSGRSDLGSISAPLGNSRGETTGLLSQLPAPSAEASGAAGKHRVTFWP